MYHRNITSQTNLFNIVFLSLLLLSFLIVTPGFAEEDSKYTERRNHLVKRTIEDRGVRDSETLRAMYTVPRHEFVPEKFREHAYEDRPLPIGLGQTISQPYIVAYMTELLEVDENSVTLEIGTGPGIRRRCWQKLSNRSTPLKFLRNLAKRPQNDSND